MHSLPHSLDPSAQVEGKVNAISLDKCARVGLLFDRVVASVELVNSSSIDVQCMGGVPTLAIDACDGVQVGRWCGEPRGRSKWEGRRMVAR